MTLPIHIYYLRHPTQRQDVVAATSTSQRRRMYVSNKTANDVSVGRHQDISVVCLHDVLLVCRDDISCNSQMKHPITSLWYVSTTSQSYVVVTLCLYCGFYYFFKCCHDLQLVGFHVSFELQIKHHIFLVPTRREKREVVWIIN